MEWLSVLPPVAAIIVAIWSRNVYWALGLAILLSETLQVGLNPALGALGSIDRATGVFADPGNTRILLFCLIIGALIAYLERAGAFAAMVRWLMRSGVASGPKRASGVTAVAGIILFIETNISLLATGLLGKPLFDKVRLSRVRLAYIIDSTCAPVSVLILLNGWGAFILGLLATNGVDAPLGVLVSSIGLNFYAFLTLALVFFTVVTNRTFGPMRAFDAAAAQIETLDEDPDPQPGALLTFILPMLILVGGSIGFMWWTGGGNILAGSGSKAILWSVILATAAAFLLATSNPALRGTLLDTGFEGMGKLLPAVIIIFMALALGDSLKALGTGLFLSNLASSLPAPWLIPAALFLTASVTSFTTGTSWGTYGILIPVAIPLAVGAGIPLPLVIAAVMGGGVFGDHCSPISDTTIIASLASGCDHLDHVRTQLPYALLAGGAATLLYVVAGLTA
ncbi:Na+/H+ antiporter family protein [Hyphomonas neptunium ATCC 15444]|uniref:Na+/H+ antiporter family protein n=2 Tax=Hyphomonas TaxID=85 RepID=Q0C0S2_HYPNA|nr:MULTISPECIES: Na+/H+ antiporter NhaC family protein [Hyphomonas]ABI78851.1 Na+/H+ antiporter family protein [Hyphomonas neptunium ATCC 15444]KCZ88236.1 Na+/H+ antiporter family protein [Hyphomonas hirschiana VP5]